MESDAPAVEGYLDDLPDDRREIVDAVRATILDRLPEGYEEAVAWGMLTYQIPMERSGPTYNGKPLMYVALASQKRHLSLYLSAVYADPDQAERFKEAYLATGKRLDMGKSCVRFRSLDDLPLELVGDAIAATSVDDYLALVRAADG